MALESKNIDILLHKRDWLWLWLIVASFGVAVLLIKPSTPAQWVVALILIAPTVWFVFVGPSALYNWQKNHRYAFVGWVVVTIRIALLFFVVWYVAPRAISLLGVWLHG
ncbi:MAG: hypothetical protein CVV05_14325 [Gammaproteobacteria bacterium HGW-Gammaproteobacteria-1]|jgi:hypothetical protein|nr:MAG: hypothetical protein CVV05_14325 [Gammaproteobacteria bacterium HGW-Gammaproteobacteria-1]